MDADLKKILKAVVLEMRHELEGYYDNAGKWYPGDLETRLAEIGVRKDRASVPVDELGRLTEVDVYARKIVDAFIDVREQAGVVRADAVAEYIRESAYTWANRLVALRCMEARELLDDEVIVGREAYGGRSLVHHRLAQSSPELCTGEDDGRFAMLAQVFAERATTLPMLFDLDSPSIALRPSPAALKNCLAWLSGTQKVRSQEPASDAVFSAPDALGWAYQYWNTEEKDRVFETVRTKKGAKIEGADIIPATQLYTEDYMVKFLVQNSLGATWMGMYPDSKLPYGSPRPASGRGAGGEGYGPWEYYVRDADRAPAKKKPLRQVTLLDPACGSGHFLIEAFDMFYAMYEEEGTLKDPEAICKSILENNLFGIDIDERAIQIAEASLWMKAEERSFGFSGANTNLVAATSSHLKGESWERFLTTFEKEPHIPRVLREFARSIEHIDELGSLARPYEALKEIIKAEHEIWEKQERDRLEGGNFLFQELRDDVLASLLPFQDISDKEFFERTMRHALFAIDGFTKDARESGEFNDQLMGIEAKIGFRLLNLLSRTYDVVVANPPYMGSKNMGSIVKAYIETYLNPGKRDIYAAFMIRSLQLSDTDARVAMVVPQTWMFLGSFADLRKGNLTRKDPRSDSVNEKGIIGATWIEVVCQLGRHAFTEADPPSNVAMCIFAHRQPDRGHVMTGIRITMSCPAETQARFLLDATNNKGSELLSRPEQVRFLSIPESPLVYWLTDSLHNVLANPSNRFGEVATTRYGMNTGDNDRFVRFFWETPRFTDRWVPYAKAGGYSKWTGMEWYMLEWESEGARIRGTGTAKVQNSQFYFEEGVTYTLMARGAFGARRLPAKVAFDSASLSIFPLQKNTTSLHDILAVSNCRVTSYMLRVLAADIKFNPGYVDRAPFIHPRHIHVIDFVDAAVSLKAAEIASVPTERSFDFTKKRSTDISIALRHIVEGELERIVADEFGLSKEDLDVITSETGIPSSWFPIINDHVNRFLSEVLCDCESRCISQSLIEDILSRTPQVNVSPPQLEKITQELRFAYEQGDVAPSLSPLDDIDNHELEDDDVAASFMPIPTETWIEKYSNKLKLHPISVALLTKTGIEDQGWRSRTERQIHAELRAAVSGLRAIGYKWPGEIECEQGKIESANQTSIFALTECTKEKTFHEYVHDRFYTGEDDAVLRESTGKPLKDWLATEFFIYHVRQFKKRPVAWQIQSTSFTNRKSPAFACLINYSRVDADTIAKVRSQYTRTLSMRYETEHRGITATADSERTSRHTKRAVELEELLTELQSFDKTLATIAHSGFGPDVLMQTLRQYAFDDGMLAMTSRWLTRLSTVMEETGEEIAGANEAAWVHKLFNLQFSALDELHPSLSKWIAESLKKLNHHCSQVSPKAPKASNTVADPTSVDFAELIQPQAQGMISKSVELACDVWYAKFAEAELQPRKEQIKSLKEEQKSLKEQIKRLKELRDSGGAEADSEDEEPFALQQKSMDGQLSNISPADRVKQLTAEIKRLEQDLKKIEAAVRAIRKSITDWSSDEPLKWGEWLAAGPMFDQISSLDERRPPPKTIADFIAQESLYAPDINDGVRVNIAPLQKAGLLAADVLAAKDVDKAIADRAKWRADERRWVREGKLPQPGWWKEKDNGGVMMDESDTHVNNHGDQS